jgi:hypothetical protein
VELEEDYPSGERLDIDKPGSELCGKSDSLIERRENISELVQVIEELKLERLKAEDYLIFQTENNTYRLTMLDPARRYGLLSGGPLGGNGFKAKLLAFIPECSMRFAGEAGAIKTRSRAVFILDTAGGAIRLITSVITRLTQVRGGRTTEPIVAATENFRDKRAAR